MTELSYGDLRKYQRGLTVAHSLDEGGMPDMGVSIGLGNGAMLYLGERTGKEGWCLSIYKRTGPALHIAEGIEPGLGSDALEAMNLIAASIAGGE